ncbi:MAG: hypothetical protein U0746_01965 [Gemmataceae bacterium]
MAQRKAFLLRIDPVVLHAVQRLADADLRSLNGQIEFLLRRALAQHGIKLPEPGESRQADGSQPSGQAENA